MRVSRRPWALRRELSPQGEHLPSGTTQAPGVQALAPSPSDALLACPAALGVLPPHPPSPQESRLAPGRISSCKWDFQTLSRLSTHLLEKPDP